MTGLESRWRGDVRIVGPEYLLLVPQLFTAKKDWDCGLSVVEGLAVSDARWRVLIHEALHSVSVGLSPQDYQAHRGWEEGVIEAMQRQLRPDVLARLGLLSVEAASAQMENAWSYEPYVTALGSLLSEFEPIREVDFLRTLLAVRLRDRKAYVFDWGRRNAPDFKRFKRVYAAASGYLSR